METGSGGAGLRGERGTGGPGQAGGDGIRRGGSSHAPVLKRQPSFCSGRSPRGCWEAVGFTFHPARIPAGGHLFLSHDICFEESDGAAPSEAQITALLLPPAVGLWLGQAGSQLGGFAPPGWQRWICQDTHSPPLFPVDLPYPSATPSLKLPAAPALLVIPLAMKPWGLDPPPLRLGI